MKVTAVKIMLLAEDMERALSFYETVFGFERRFVSEHWSELAYGDCIIAFHSGGDGSASRTPFSIQVEDIQTLGERMNKHGGKLIVAPAQRPYEPIIYSEIADTENNIVMVTQYVGE